MLKCRPGALLVKVQNSASISPTLFGRFRLVLGSHSAHISSIAKMQRSVQKYYNEENLSGPLS